MSEDVEMLDVHLLAHNVSPRSPADIPASFLADRNSTASVRNDVISLTSRDNSLESTSEHDGRALVGDVDHDVRPPASKKMRHSSSGAGSKPASTAGAGVKPKSSKPSRPRSPSPTPPPPPPPPLQTTRLQIRLGGPDNYEVDVASMAKATGQRPSTPTPRKPDTSESEGEDTHDEHGKRKKKKKHIASEYYDITDPFIDDSEINIDNRTHFAQTKQQGFYVSSGEVALMKDSKTPKKPKSKKPPTTEAGPSKQEDGTKEHPFNLLGEEKVGKKRKNYTVIEENGKKRKVVDVREFHPELQAAIDNLKVAISKESWNVKGKFPASIKPILADVALKAIHLGEYDEDFFSLMPVLFPYNRFTMTKLIKRTIFNDYLRILTTRQDELLAQLAALTKEGFPKAQEEWEKSVAAWEKRQEKAKAELEAGAASTPSVSEHTHHEDAGTASGAEGEGPAAKPDGSRDAHPPAQKYRLTEAMKSTIWQLVMLSNECCRLENEKNELEGSNAQVSEQGLRKVLYQKIVAAFPPGWLNSGQISREVSSMKKKFEKEAMEQEG